MWLTDFVIGVEGQRERERNNEVNKLMIEFLMYFVVVSFNMTSRRDLCLKEKINFIIEKENDLCHQKLSERFQISMGAISNVPHIQKWICDYLKSVCVTDTELVKMINYLCLYCKGSETNSVFLLSSWWQMHEDVSIALVVRAPEAQDNTPQQTRHLTKETEQIYPQ